MFMELWFYYLMFTLSLVNLVIMLFMTRFQRGSYYILMSVTVAFCNGGYLSVAHADNLSTALLGAKISCIGAALLPMFVFLSISTLCRLAIRDKIIFAQIVYGFILICCVLTIGHNDLYYKTAKLERTGDVSFLIKEYGPLHDLYIFTVVAYAIAMVAVIIYALVSQRKVSYKNTIVLGILGLLNIFVYAFERIFEVKVEFQPIALVIAEYTVLLLLRRVGMFDVSASVANALENNKDYGYIVFDKKLNYINANVTAKSFFDEIEKCRLDCPIDKKFTSLYSDIVMPILTYKKNKAFNIHYVTCNDKKIKCTIRDLYHDDNNKKTIGYIVEMTDDTKQQEYISLLRRYNKELEEEVDVQHGVIKDLQQQMVVGMAELVEGRDNSTGGHIKRTSECMQIFADELQKNKCYNKPDWFWEYVVKVAPMHDLGKITTADNILLKPGEFTTSEYEEMKMHAEKGALIVEKILGNINNREFVDIARNVAHYHHEKWDGTGYPEGLNGKQIPLEARVMAFVDVLDALVSKRVYKEEYEFDKAFGIIHESLGKTFDPELGGVFMGCRDKLEAFYRSQANE